MVNILNKLPIEIIKIIYDKLSFEDVLNLYLTCKINKDNIIYFYGNEINALKTKNMEDIIKCNSVRIINYFINKKIEINNGIVLNEITYPIKYIKYNIIKKFSIFYYFIGYFNNIIFLRKILYRLDLDQNDFHFLTKGIASSNNIKMLDHILDKYHKIYENKYLKNLIIYGPEKKLEYYKLLLKKYNKNKIIYYFLFYHAHIINDELKNKIHGPSILIFNYFVKNYSNNLKNTIANKYIIFLIFKEYYYLINYLDKIYYINWDHVRNIDFNGNQIKSIKSDMPYIFVLSEKYNQYQYINLYINKYNKLMNSIN